MKGSDFIATLPEAPGPDRESKILEAVCSGLALPIQWATITANYNGHSARLQVASDALAIGEGDDWVRVTVTHATAQKIADVLGAALPTSRISDLTYQQASVVLKACLQKPDASMSNTSRMVFHNQCIEAQRAGKTGLISTVGKDWVLTNQLVGHPDKAANYGWHDARAPYYSPGRDKIWQPVGLAHNLAHTDYSQTLRLVRTSVVVDDEEMSLEDVLTSSVLYGLVSYEGPLKITRHPGVPPYTPSGAAPPMPTTPATPTVPTIPAPPPVASGIKFVQAKNYTKVKPAAPRKVNLVVLHSMEAAEKPTTAEAVASWFAGFSAPRASAHFCVDSDSIVQCVKEQDVAWAAPGANASGIHVEHAGYARQTAAEWMDAFSWSMLNLSARLVADVCRRWAIPVEYVSAEGLLEGGRGITTHLQVTLACQLAKKRNLTRSPFYSAQSNHTDPGVGFPMVEYLGLVESA